MNDSTNNQPNIQDVLSRLRKVKKGANSYTAQCPTHDDQRNSLSVREGDNGRIVLKCHAGCTYQQVEGWLGIGGANWTHPTRKTYDYRDEGGELLYQVVRFEPKDFRQRRPDGRSDWTWNLNGVRRVPYRLPHLLEADQRATVFIVEGEKDADRLASLGLVATTNAGGAGKWRDDYNEHLRGRHVCILPDNDETGRAHARTVADSLRGLTAGVRVVELPGLPEKGDVSDWLDSGGTVEQLRALFEVADSRLAAADATPESASTSSIVFESASDLMAREFPELKWAVDGLLSEGASVCAGAPKVGKSYLALGLAIAIASGGRALGSLPVQTGDVLYLGLEDGDRRMKKRLKGMLDGSGVPERLTFAYKFPRIDEGGLEAIEEWLKAHPDARLIVVDTLKRVRPVERRIKRFYDGDYDAVAPLNDLGQRYGVSVLIIHHTNKMVGNEDWFDSISGSLGLSAAVDNLMLLRRQRRQQKGTLHVAGRDIEDKALDVEFDGVIKGWKLMGDALTDLAVKILTWLLEAAEAGLSRTDINKKNGGRSDGVEGALEELKGRGLADFKSLPTKGKKQERWFATAVSANDYGNFDDNDDVDDESFGGGIGAADAELTPSKSSPPSIPFVGYDDGSALSDSSGAPLF
jgi:hypothetical protein